MIDLLLILDSSSRICGKPSSIITHSLCTSTKSTLKISLNWWIINCLSPTSSNSATFKMWIDLEILLCWDKCMWGSRRNWFLPCTKSRVCFRVLITALRSLIWSPFLILLKCWRHVFLSSLRLSACKSVHSTTLKIRISIDTGLANFF